MGEPTPQDPGPRLRSPPFAFRPDIRLTSFCTFVARPYATRTTGTDLLGCSGEPTAEFEARTPPASKSLCPGTAAVRPTTRATPKSGSTRRPQVKLRQWLRLIRQLLAPWREMMPNDAKTRRPSPSSQFRVRVGEPCTRLTNRQSRRSHRVAVRNGKSSVSVLFTASLAIALFCTGLHSVREFHRRSQGDWRSTRRQESNGEPPIAPASRVRRL